MATYIEREALMDEFRRYMAARHDREKCVSEENCKTCDKGCLWRKVVNEAPAADVAPVVHAKWVGLEYDGYADGCPVYDLWECSNCGEEVSGEDVPDTHPWCHGCGAKMKDGE